MTSEITFSKGTYSVTIYGDINTENYSNKLFPITPAQSAANQALGPVDTKVVDLLRITHQLVMKGFLVGTSTVTAKTIKDNLINIFKGGGTAGGTVAMTYDGDTINGYIEKLSLILKPYDEPDDWASSPSSYGDVIRYEVAITFIAGVSI